jgi:tetratricopeptide (TPR) repeat protein/transcriptional regulator with XRE-family HTH domain
MSDGRDLAGRLRDARTRAGLSQEQLAERSGVSIRAIRDIERGVTRGPRLDSVRRLADALVTGTARDELIEAGLVQGPDTEAPAAGGDLPRQLPARVSHFTGRTVELGMLSGLMADVDKADAAAGTVVISAIGGMAGVGKTTLAVAFAHQVASRFPDGQLFVDLHGYTADQPARSAGEALEMMLRSLGVPPQRIPADPDERAALYRQRLADSRTLIVLDNATGENQVRPLLPANPGCLVLITSRKRLKGLPDAHPVALDVLPEADATALLARIAGADRLSADDRAASEIVALCGRLPLALGMAGALLRHRPAWTAGHLVALLRDQRQRSIALSDGERDLDAVFDLSYHSLTGPQQHLFRRLGPVPGPDIDAYAATALLRTDPAAVTALLEDLVDHNLLIEHVPGRYRLHDLTRIHARVRADTEPEDDRAAALDRLLHYYGYTAQSASLRIARYPRPAPSGPAPAHVPAQPDPETARAWLRAERDNIEAASAHARTLALDSHALALTAGLAEILRTEGPFTRALALHQVAAETAERQGRPAAHALALTELGTVRRLTGDLAEAGDVLAQARDICRATGDRLGEAGALTELGRVRTLSGDLAGAAHDHEQALGIYRAIGHGHGEATALTELGAVRRLTGDLAGAHAALTSALDICGASGDRHNAAYALTELGRVRTQTGDLAGASQAIAQALDDFRATGNRNLESHALTDLGVLRRLTGDLAGAEQALAQAVDIYQAIGHRHGEASALTELGTTRRLAGDLARARETVARALAVFRATGDRNNEAWALNHYAAIIATAGDEPQARDLYREALVMNRELSKPDDEAVALEGLGECHLRTGDIHTGTAHLRAALAIFQRLTMTLDADRVHDRLARLASRAERRPPPGRDAVTRARPE